MPELPEVETFAREIIAAVGGRRIDAAACSGLPYCRESVGLVEETVPGNIVTGYRRHGKALFLQLSDGLWLYVHFGMSGRPLAFDGDEPPYTRLRIDADGSRIAVQDPRRLGGVGVIRSPDEFLSSRRRGPDALSVTEDEFLRRFKGRRAVKAALLDQSLVCGVGNLYADEVLFQNRILPARRVDELDDEEKRGIFLWIGKALRASLDVGTDFSRLPQGMMLRDRSKGSACPDCGEVWSTATVGGRTSYFCRLCQH